jgi:NADH-quinone oxidoreductase subunit J
MIGAIVLTLRHREGVRRQKVGDQQARQAKDSLRLVDIPSGSGI